MIKILGSIKNIEEALRNLKHAFATSDRSKKKFF